MFVAKKWKCNCNFIGHFRFAGNCVTALDFGTHHERQEGGDSLRSIN